MTKATNDLDILFDASRKMAQEPSKDLLAGIFADAGEVAAQAQQEIQTIPAASAKAGPSLSFHWLWGLAAPALMACAVFGFFLGYSDLTSTYLVDYVPVMSAETQEDLTGFDSYLFDPDAMLEIS